MWKTSWPFKIESFWFATSGWHLMVRVRGSLVAFCACMCCKACQGHSSGSAWVLKTSLLSFAVHQDWSHHRWRYLQSLAWADQQVTPWYWHLKTIWICQQGILPGSIHLIILSMTALSIFWNQNSLLQWNSNLKNFSRGRKSPSNSHTWRIKNARLATVLMLCQRAKQSQLLQNDAIGNC